MQINSSYSTQNFGMALKLSPEALNIIKTRINETKFPEKEVDKLQKIIEENVSNKFHIEVNKAAGRQLNAFIYDGSTYCSKVKRESIFESLFKSPIKFLKNMSDDASKILQDSERSAKIDNLLK